MPTIGHRKYTQADLQALPMDKDGYVVLLSGDWSGVIFNDIKVKAASRCLFGDSNVFARDSHFGHNCCFGKSNIFGATCSFREYCTFGDANEFRLGCHFDWGYCRFGNVCIFSFYCHFLTGCQFGSDCYFDNGCYFGAQCRFGNGCYFGDFCCFNSGCNFARGCTFSCCICPSRGGEYESLYVYAWDKHDATVFLIHCGLLSPELLASAAVRFFKGDGPRRLYSFDLNVARWLAQDAT